MSKRNKLFLVHGLHILAIGIIGFFVLKNIREDGGAVLFKALNQSCEKANKQLQNSLQVLSEAIESQARAYLNERYVQSYQHSKNATHLAKTVLNKFRNGGHLPEEDQHLLLTYCDSLARYFDKDLKSVRLIIQCFNLLCEGICSPICQMQLLRNGPFYGIAWPTIYPATMK